MTSVVMPFVPLHACPAGLVGRFAPSGFVLASCFLSLHAFYADKNFFKKKKCVSIDLNCSETHRNAKKCYPFDPLRALCLAQSPSGEAQPYLPHVFARVLKSIHAKFHADWSKTGRQRDTDKQTDRATLIIQMAYWFSSCIDYEFCSHFGFLPPCFFKAIN